MEELVEESVAMVVAMEATVVMAAAVAAVATVSMAKTETTETVTTTMESIDNNAEAAPTEVYILLMLV